MHLLGTKSLGNQRVPIGKLYGTRERGAHHP
ncbi:hypothetical protein Godav_011408 [Gossypium davidsonii]|uniref:Uncharacterized protein n=2 Tax=Gossypium TaxID=3633 RepID=A0A7J8R9R0_GOSDV|nr:hypothetical protein [Gossypium davidsonii]MBA0645679.1 hypothetical protein [Gossypium klotzschianum]